MEAEEGELRRREAETPRQLTTIFSNGSLESSYMLSPDKRPVEPPISFLLLFSVSSGLTMRNDSINGLRPTVHQSLGGQTDGGSRVAHVIDEDRHLVLDVSDEDLHPALRVGRVALAAIPIDEGKVDVQAVGKGGSAVGREE